MLPVPQDQRLPRATATPPRRAESHPERLFVERRATRRPTAAQARRRRVLQPRWILLAASPFLLGTAFALAGLVGLAVVGVVLLLAAQGLAISALRARAARLGALSRTDELTGLGNSRALWTDLRELATSSPAALIMLDLDHFKRVNDEYGHPVGDALLRHAGRTLRIVVGDLGRCYRYGGEELVAVLPGLDEEIGLAIAERLRAIIVRPPRDLPRVTASAGVAVGSPGASAHHLVDRADRALRFAKANGRDRTIPASLAQDWAPDREDSVVAARRAALAMATAALDARDPDTAEHSDEVVMLCDALADRLGIDGRAKEHLLTAARLHDVGKVAVPHEILAKPSSLDAQEWEVMREHTVTGERILCSVPELAPVAPIVRHAHERYDGGGYPDGLSGEDIPLASRVILCADAFHAIRSDRPYRAARSVDEALHELITNAGGQFDPSVTASLVSVVRDVREETPAASLRVALRRSPRLLALLMTLVIGGSAFAAQRPLRHVFGGVLPGLDKDQPVPTTRAAGEPASCATITLEGTACPRAIAVLGPLTLAAPASPGAPPAGPESVLMYEPAQDTYITVGDGPVRVSGPNPGGQALTVAAQDLFAPPVPEASPSGDEPVSAAAPSFEAPTAPVGPAEDTGAPVGLVPVVDPPADQVVGDLIAPETPPAIDPGDSGSAPGQDLDGAGNSEDAPGQDPAGPGNSEDAPGQDPAGPANSEDAPGQDSPATDLPADPAIPVDPMVLQTGGVLAPDETPVIEPAVPTDTGTGAAPPTPAVLPDVPQDPAVAVEIQ